MAHVQRDRLEPGGALADDRPGILAGQLAVGPGCERDLRVELGEEPVGGLLARPIGAPHDLAATVVGDQREVVVLALPADLVDPDVEQLVEPVGIELVVADAPDDPPDRAPVDPEQPLDRGLVGPSREPCDQAFEVAGELRARAGERNALSPRSVHRAPQPPPAAVDLEPPDPEVQVPPDGVLRPRVLPRPARVPTLRADQPPAAQRDLHPHLVGLEPNLPDPHPRQAEKPGECRGDAHAVPPCKPLTFKQPAACNGGQRRVAEQRATSENFLTRRKTCSAAQTGSNRHHIDAGRPVFLRCAYISARDRSTVEYELALRPGHSPQSPNATNGAFAPRGAEHGLLVLTAGPGRMS